MPFNDLIGRKFGFLRVIAKAGTDKYRRRQWRVQCECGVTERVLATNLLSGRSKSCGCESWRKARIRMKTLMLAEKFCALLEKGMTREQAKGELDRSFTLGRSPLRFFSETALPQVAAISQRSSGRQKETRKFRCRIAQMRRAETAHRQISAI